jgi:gas vesicle protein
MKRQMATALVIFSVTGCATPGDRARTEGTAGGAAIGAAIGGILGRALGGDSKSTAIGAAIGATIGGAVGYSYADRIAKRHRELAGREDDLDAQIQFAKGVNQDTQEYNRILEREITNVKPQTDRLVAQIHRNDITQEQLKQERKNLDTMVSTADKQLKLAQNQLDRLRRFQNTQASPELDQQIANLEAKVETLERNTQALASQRQRI